MKNLGRINRFYIVMALVLVVLAVLVAVSFRGIFASMSLAGEIDESLLSSDVPRLDEDKINDALNSVQNRTIPALDL